MGSRGLMDRALDLKPEVTQGCGFDPGSGRNVHDWGETLEQGTEHPTTPRAAVSAAHCSRCVWMG